MATTALVLSLPNWRIGLMPMGMWPAAKIAVQIAIIASTLSLGVAPLASSMISIAAYSVDLCLPYPYLESNGWCLIAAVGYIAFRVRPATAATVFAYMCGLQYVELSKTGMPITFNAMTSLCGSYAAALIIGILVRRQRELERLRRQSIRVRQIERNLDIAHRLHDATSGELTSISLTAQLGIRKTQDTEQRELFDRIVDQSAKALDHVHDIIRLLAIDRADVSFQSHNREQPERQSSTSAWAPSRDVDLRAVTERMEHELHDAGFIGTITVDDVPAEATKQFDDDRYDLLIALLREITTDIIRHGDHDNRRYTLHIAMTGNGIDITQSNPMSQTPETSHATDRQTDECPSTKRSLPDHGLALLRHRVIIHSGSMTTATDHGVWRLHVSLPMTARIAATADIPESAYARDGESISRQD